MRFRIREGRSTLPKVLLRVPVEARTLERPQVVEQEVELLSEASGQGQGEQAGTVAER
jgi:hypothetical protein